jgi:hypothetical protein
MRIFPTFISEFVAKFWLIPLVNDCQCGYITKSLLPNITIIQLYRKKSELFKLHNCLNSSPPPSMNETYVLFFKYPGVLFANTCFVCKYFYGSFRSDDKPSTRGVSHLWPCHLHYKSILKGKRRRIMETQIFHHAKV